MSRCCALRPVVYELQVSLLQVHQMTPNQHKHYQVRGTPDILYCYLGIPNIIPFHSMMVGTLWNAFPNMVQW